MRANLFFRSGVKLAIPMNAALQEWPHTLTHKQLTLAAPAPLVEMKLGDVQGTVPVYKDVVHFDIDRLTYRPGRDWQNYYERE